MTTILYATLYACALAFVAGCLVRAVRYARTPPHLRWELYPVPHEPPARAAHGGSYFEQLDWWTKPREFHFFAELGVMLAEILLLRGVWEHNRKLWFLSFPFHFGLYLIAASASLLVSSAILSGVNPAAAAGSIGYNLHVVYSAAGAAGALLAFLGAAGLLIRRLADPEVRTYTTAGDVFNLLAFLVTLALLAAGYPRQWDQPTLREITLALLTFDRTIRIPGLFAVGLVMAGLLAAYIPLTQMSHFIAKYFTYHSVRWNDHPAGNGSALEKKLADCLGYRPSWAAPHVGADGAKTWVDIALSNPAQQGKK
jgi:nitrate reductase gamma subunit